MRTLSKLGTLVFITTLIGSAVAAPVMAADPKGPPKPTEVRPGKGSAQSEQVAPASLPIGSDIGDPNAGPLTHIGIGTDLSCAVNHRDDGTVGEFYGDTACGTFLALNGVLYGPPNIPAGGSAQPLTPWTQVSQTTTGDGSGGNPKKVTTEVTAGATGVHVIEEDRYTFGQESYSTLVRVENRGTDFANFTLYRAADCFLGNDDFGFGHTDLNGIGTTVQCVASKIQPDGSRAPGDRRIEWYPLTQFSRYIEAFYDDVWANIGRQENFPNTVLPADVYRDNGAGLSWAWGLAAGNSADFAHLLSISPDFAAHSVCALEDLAFTKVSGRVTIHYDPRYLWPEKDQDYVTKAGWIAQEIAQRADTTLAKYQALGFRIPAVVNGKIKCDPELFGRHRDANVDAPGVFNLKADWLKTAMADFVDQKVRGQSPSIAHTDVSDNIDHELVHIVQVEQEGLLPTIVDLGLAGDYAVTEGSAVFGQDLVSDIDDDPLGPQSAADYRSRSFLGVIHDFVSDPRAVDYTSGDDARRPYSVAGFYEYLSEQRAGATNHLEQHGAQFITDLLHEGTHFGAVAHAMGATSQEAVLNALRDFYVTLYVHKRANASTLPFRFRILDEITAFDQQAGSGSAPSWEVIKVEHLTTPLVAGVPLVFDENAFKGEKLDGLDASDGGVMEIPLPAGTTEVRVTVQDHPDVLVGRAPVGRLRVGFVPLNGANQATIDPGMFKLGPRYRQTEVTDVPVVGMTTLAIFVINDHPRADFKVTVETRAGAPGITVDPVSPVAQDEVGGGIQAFVHPSVAGVPSRGLPTRSYTAKIDGTTVTVGSTFDLTTSQMLLIKPNGALTLGAHTLQLSYGSASASSTFQVQSPGGGQRVAGAPSKDGSVTNVAPESTTTGTIFTVLNIGGAGRAGEPIDISFVLADQGIGLPGASVVATLTDPVGGVRQVPLADDGSVLDGGASDGFYGTQAFGTDRAGTWTVSVNATGTTASGPFNLTETASIILASKVDVDGDGVADAIEPSFGLSPADPADGAFDDDNDGATAAQELAVGSDPYSPDTDSGGEADGSEIASGRSPLLLADDRVIPDPILSVEAIDGRSFSVSVGSRDQTAPVHLYRVNPDATIVDLGARPGTFQIVTDGPLAAGTYEYRAVTEMASGARSVPVSSGPVDARDDATPPSARILLNDNRPASNSTHIGVLFVDVSESLSDMRLAGSLAALETASWQPFAPSTSFDVASGDGSKAVFAQVRDAAGLISGPVTNAIILDTIAPSSAAAAIPAITTTPSVSITFTATDARSSIDIVELWARTRPNAGATWGAWSQVGFSPTSPITYVFPSDGLYEFATIAVDAAGNREPGPTAADTSTTVDHVAPSSSVGTLPATVAGTTLAIPYTASDAVSGVASVQVWSRYRSTSTGTWGAWTLGPTGTTSPISYSFANGNGFYEFYTIAIDAAGNSEAPPAVADATTQRLATGDTTPPTSPSNPTATTTRFDLVKITWTAATDNVGVTRYTIWRAGTPIAVVDGTVTTFADRSTTPNETYGYKVTASDAAGNTGPPSNTVAANTGGYAPPPDLISPTAPTNVTASISGTASNAFKPISINWLKSTDNVAVVRYAIYRDAVQIGIDDASGSTGETYTDRTSEPGKSYLYTVRGVDAAGNLSPISNAAGVATPACSSFCSSATVRPVVDINSAGFTASPAGWLFAQLDEPTSDGDTTYIVGPTSGTASATFGMGAPAGRVFGATVRFVARQVVTSGQPGTMNVRVELYDGSVLVRTGTTRNLTTTYVTYSETFAGLSISSGANYRVKIVQVSPGTNKIRSRFTYLDSTVTYFPPDTAAPTTPSGLTATATAETQIRLTWSASTDNDGVLGYNVYRNGVQVGTFAVDSPAYNDTGLYPTTTYTYTVRAVDAAGNISGLSPAAGATTLAVPPDTLAPSTPRWGTATSASSTRINLAWNPSIDNLGVQGYFVFRDGVQVGTLPVGSVSFSDTGLTPNTPYTYSLEAIDAAGNRSARSTNNTVGTQP